MQTLRFPLAVLVSLVIDAGHATAAQQTLETPLAADSADATQSTPTSLRDVRVLIAAKAKRVRVRADDGFFLLNEDGVRVSSVSAGTWHIIDRRPSERIRIDGEERSLPIGLEPEPGETLDLSVFRGGSWSKPLRYPGSLELRPTRGGIDVINHVDVETYVACVVANEVWPTFQTEAYRAQAVVSRSYVLFQMQRRPSALVDVSAAQGSQVYRGVRTDAVGQRAVEAARFTRGIVLTYVHEGRDELFCTYFSAACGGLSQSAAIFGEEGDIPPLRGGVRCDYCAIAPRGTYRWGPVKLTLRELQKKLVARYPKMKTLGKIRSVNVVEKTKTGRPLRLRIRGTKGKPKTILAERFRLAIGASILKSTDFKIENGKGVVVFKNGRGFGHGLGLCQWGMEGQAREGRRAGEILRFYFPGSKLTRVY